jgi:hypothetical protein
MKPRTPGFWLIVATVGLLALLPMKALAGMTPEEVKMFEGYRTLAEKGDREAQHKLGFCFSQGRGVAQDDVQAVSWFRKAAELGYAPAQYSLGVRTFAGLGVARDQVKAVAWYRKAAQQGHAEAQSNLGYLFAIGGNGVAKDEVEAYAYWNLGGTTEQTDLRNKLTILVAKMSPGKIAAGKKRAIELQKEIETKIAAKSSGK